MDGIKSLLAARRPTARLGRASSVSSGTVAVTGLAGDTAGMDAVPTGSSEAIASGSAVVIIYPSGDRQLGTGVGIGGWVVPDTTT